MISLAAVFRAPDVPLELRSIEVPPLNAGEILVRIDCCTICGSDVHTIRGSRPVAGPTILGHEMIGRVAAIARQRSPSDELREPAFDVGERITWSITASCGNCFFCKNDLPQKCENSFKYGHEILGERTAISGGMSQYCVLVPGTKIVRLKSSLPDSVACPANCATATVAAAIRTAGRCEGKTVVVHGAGMLGLTAAALLRLEGAGHVLVTDVEPRRLQTALKFGATHVLSAGKKSELIAVITDITHGRGADVVLDMSGSTEAIESSFDQLRTGGHLILVGSVFPSRPMTIQPERIVRKMLRIDGVHNYAPMDLFGAIRFLERAHAVYPFHELVGAEYSLNDVNEAVGAALRGDAPRIAIRMND